jgi:hypothetical protein
MPYGRPLVGNLIPAEARQKPIRSKFVGAARFGIAGR